MRKNKSKKKFTLRIILSYLILGALVLIAGIFILSEVKTYLAIDSANENDTKLLKTSAFLTQLYEAESLSKLALQTKTKENFNTYAQKIDAVSSAIDSLKAVITSDYQLKLLDSVQHLLLKKTYNNEELRRLKIDNLTTNSIDSALEKFNSMELSLHKITAKGIVPNIDELSPEAKTAIEKLVVVLNNNIPEENKENYSTQKIDSIIKASKIVLNEAKEKDATLQRSLAQKEMEIYSNDLEVSQQLRSIIIAFDQEVMNTTITTNQQKQAVLTRSTRLAGIAALLGFFVVGLFTFLITRDYWRVQSYRQNLEEEKKFSESLLKSREQLIATVSHDLRTPLNTITGYSELMENTALSPKQGNYLKNVKSAAQYVDNLVNDLLDYSKLEAGKLKIETIPFILSELLEETAFNLQEINQKKPIQLHLEIADELRETLVGDPFRIRQIITNLISNAYKFTQEGAIKILAQAKIHNTDTYNVSIKIIDSGIGIAKEKQEAIFKEFTQAEDSTEKKYGGYGLGLTISKKLAKLLKGNLSVTSELAKGSEFILEIPLQISKNKMVAIQKQHVLAAPAHLSIVIIDDDTAMLGLLKEVCSALGIHALTFSNFEAVAKKTDLKYDVVLTDIQMPKTDGFYVLQQFKNGRFTHFQGQPILAMTGRKDLDKSTYTQAGFEAVLQKPFTKATFIAQLASLFPEKLDTAVLLENPTRLRTTASLYSLEPISSFLGNNSEAIQEVIETFLKDTEDNIKTFQKAIHKNNIEAINAASHRMLPMFRQLDAKQVVPILEEFESLKKQELSHEKIKTQFTLVQQQITILIAALKKDSSIYPNYSD